MSLPHDPRIITFARQAQAIRDGVLLITQGSPQAALVLILAAAIDLSVMMDKDEWIEQMQSALKHGSAATPTPSVH